MDQPEHRLSPAPRSIPHPVDEDRYASSVAFRSIGFSVGARSILRGVDLSIAAGQILCLLGPSGSGKTSLLRIAAGIERQTAGQVFIGGREMAGPDRFVPPEQRGVGLMFQDFALFPHLSLLDNVRFGLRGLRRSEQPQVALEALERIGLDHLAHAFPHSLSGGEQQRVAMARAMTPRPQVLLMDEPFSGLDSRLRDDMRTETISVLRDSKATAIIVTHDPEEALRLGDHIALLRDGELVQYGTGRDLYHRPIDLFTAKFFSEINTFAGVVKAGRVESPFGVVADSPRSDGTKVVVAVRLEGIRVSTDSGAAKARVIGRRFLGKADLLTLAVPGFVATIGARVRADELADGVHDVFVSVEPQDVFVFEDSSGTA